MKIAMKHSLYLLPAAALAAVLLGAGTACAAGFELREQGGDMQGMSYAGAAAMGNDASTIFYNPAGMTQLERDQMSVSAANIMPSAQFNITNSTISGNNGGDAGGSTLLPSVYLMHVVNPRTRVGLAINTPFGLQTRYHSGWVGRYYALDSSLNSIDIAPSAAYKLTDKLSIGGGLDIQYVKARLTNAINVAAITATPGAPDGLAKVSGDDWGIGYNLGMQYAFSENTRVGVAYRSRVKHGLEGKISFSNIGPLSASPLFSNADVEAGLTTPDTLSVGAVHRLSKKWTVAGQVEWTNWSVFNELSVRNQNGGTNRETIQENWKDTYFAALGAQYDYTEATKLQFGVAYDTSPVGVTNRTFRIPDTRRIWVSTGLVHDLNKHWRLGGGYTHIFGNDAPVDESSGAATGSGSVQGTFDTSVDIVNLQLTYMF